MRKTFITLLTSFLLTMLPACARGGSASSPESITITGSFVFVVDEDADDTARQAAVCLQTTLMQKFTMFQLPIDHKDPGSNVIALHVDSAMASGACTLELKSSGIYLTAQESHALLHVAKQLRQALLDAGTPTVTKEMCETLTQTLDISNLPFTFLSQNLLFKDIEGGNLVSDRIPRFVQLMNEYQPDILGTQECSADWMHCIESSFDGRYVSSQTVSSWGRTGNPIYFRADRYELLDAGLIWLSPTPHVLRSQFDGDSGPRNCSWALVKDILTGQTLFVADCHPDWNNDTQRALQVNVIFQELGEELQETPAILCGDFNSGPEGPIYAIVTDNHMLDTRSSASRDLSAVDHTYHNFGNASTFLDFIFHNDSLETGYYGILSDKYGGYISDHYGVIAELSFK